MSRQVLTSSDAAAGAAQGESPGLGTAPASEPAFVLRRPGSWQAHGRKYLAILGTAAREQVAYVGESLIRSVFLAMILYVFLQLWQATFASQQRTTIGGFTVAQMLWYLALTESIILSRPRLNRVVDEEIRTGSIAYTLIRPYSYAGFRFAGYLAERGLSFIVKLAVASALALLYVGPIPLHVGDLALGVVALALAMCLDFLLMFGVSLLAFWTESTTSITLIYDRLVMLLGGMLLPLDLFPPPLAGIARILPFSSLVYAPARLALGGAGEPATTLLLRQVVTLTLTALLVWALLQAAMRRLNVNGG